MILEHQDVLDRAKAVTGAHSGSESLVIPNLGDAVPYTMKKEQLTPVEGAKKFLPHSAEAASFPSSTFKICAAIFFANLMSVYLDPCSNLSADSVAF